MTEIEQIVQRHMSRRLSDETVNGRSASIVLLDEGAKLVWCGGTPVYYRSVTCAVDAARAWLDLGKRPVVMKITLDDYTGSAYPDEMKMFVRVHGNACDADIIVKLRAFDDHGMSLSVCGAQFDDDDYDRDGNRWGAVDSETAARVVDLAMQLPELCELYDSYTEQAADEYSAMLYI